jgi:hypothetical protein
VNARRSRGPNLASVLLPAAERKRIRAVVVDANAYGRVGPNLESLADLARHLSAIHVAMWIPEPVAWEWAEHLTREWRVARAAVRDATGHLRSAGLPGLELHPPYADERAVMTD